MPNSPDSTTQFPETVHRTVRLRLFPGDAETGALLAAIAGACRYVWNHMRADCEWRYARWKEMHVPALNGPEVREGKKAWAKRANSVCRQSRRGWMEGRAMAGVLCRRVFSWAHMAAIGRRRTARGDPAGDPDDP